ncbi:extracellular solute-binding protein [Paenibacillus sp. LHD-38]|uniref:ABC transporter substrate-binding protein n=1 Tax=Paenibacillus sp. LHD-38 TaxID=3072143 RepID=UPI00280EE16D|nr:extracellular solute-binding protein [Paenibacillus sp. LHD-38]MDQ8736839.1 extracellular solute-binding protein [Paenibacillus sp. LHD-38]
MTPRKYVPFLLGTLLLAALLLIPFSRDANPTSVKKPDGKSSVQPVPGELVVDQLANIHVNVSLSDPQFQQLQELNINFMMKYPHIQVKLTNEPSKNKAYDLWVLQSQQGEAADIILLDNGWVRPFAVRGFLKPADSILTGDALSDQMSGLLDPLKWNGYLWGIPKDLNPYMIVWSSSLLAEAGLKDPPADWDSYQSAALKIIELHPQASIVNWTAGDLQQQLAWLAAFQSEQSNVLNVLSVNESQEHQLEWFQDKETKVSRINSDERTRLEEAFQNNQLLAAIIPWNDYEMLNEVTRNKLTVDREQIYYPWLNGRSYVISSSSKSEEEAMQWIQEMTDINNQQVSYDRSGQLPARASLYAFNSSLQSVQSHIPPAWWKNVLDTNKTDVQLVSPDPFWPEKWQQRERLWEQFSENRFEIAAYLDALEALVK